jgi:hypothetical protein
MWIEKWELKGVCIPKDNYTDFMLIVVIRAEMEIIDVSECHSRVSVRPHKSQNGWSRPQIGSLEHHARK